jgi:hypothetical protein
MRILDKLKRLFSPRKISDPDFGELLFISMRNSPELSYWECEWRFPNTGTMISIGLPGGEEGPLPESREFFLALPSRFDDILARALPKLEKVFSEWLEIDLPADPFSELKLAGFGLEDPKAETIEWDISFETTGDKWLGIIIPFSGDDPQEAVVDT